MRPYDGQRDLLDRLEHRLSHPSLTAEELGRIALMLEHFVDSGLASQEESDRLLAPRMVGATP